jgi:DNA-binding response OmpR family regulator
MNTDFLDVMNSKQGFEPILFVEDSEDDFFIARRELQRVNICSTPDRVDSIEDLFAYLENRRPNMEGVEKLPCVIIMDLSLRGEGGLSGIAKLRSTLKYRTIPIIAISSVDQFSHLKVAVEQGVKGYLLKPFNGDEFMKIAAKLKLKLDFTAI